MFLVLMKELRRSNHCLCSTFVPKTPMLLSEKGDLCHSDIHRVYYQLLYNDHVVN
jgi:hypothetical protein